MNNKLRISGLKQTKMGLVDVKTGILVHEDRLSLVYDRDVNEANVREMIGFLLKGALAAKKVSLADLAKTEIRWIGGSSNSVVIEFPSIVRLINTYSPIESALPPKPPVPIPFIPILGISQLKEIRLANEISLFKKVVVLR